MSRGHLIPLSLNHLALKNQCPYPLSIPEDLLSDHRVLPCSQEGFYLETPEGIYNSKVKSSQEARNTIERFSKNWTQSPLIIVIGLELGYHVLEILRQCPYSSIWVLEPSLDTIVAACQVHDFSPYLGKRLHIVHISDADNIEAIAMAIPGISFHIFVHRATYEYHQVFLKSVKYRIESVFQMKSINTHTIDYFQGLWIPHTLRNLPLYLRSSGIAEIRPFYSNRSIVIVGAGPSLEKNLDTLKLLIKEQKCLVIAVNTVIPRLLYEEILPDIVVAVDPQNILYHNLSPLFHLKKAPPLIAHPSIAPAILNHYRGPIVFIETSLLQTLIPKEASPKISLDMGGSVATAAYSLAIQLQPKQIILLGMDLAYERQSHVRGNFQHQIFLFSASSRFQTWEQNLFAKGDSPGGKILHPGFFGQPVPVDYKFQTYIDWLENRFSFYSEAFPTTNCTEGGITFHSIPNIPLAQISSNLSCEPPISTFLPSASLQNSILLSEVLKKLLETLQFFEKAIDYLSSVEANPTATLSIREIMEHEWMVPKIQKPLAEIEKEQFQYLSKHHSQEAQEQWETRLYSILKTALQDNISLLKKLLPLFASSPTN